MSRPMRTWPQHCGLSRCCLVRASNCGRKRRNKAAEMRRMKVSTTRKREVLDLTDDLQQLVDTSYEKSSGFCHLSVLHTTAALTTADLDPGTDRDMLDAFEHLIPKLK